MACKPCYATPTWCASPTLPPHTMTPAPLPPQPCHSTTTLARPHKPQGATNLPQPNPNMAGKPHTVTLSQLPITATTITTLTLLLPLLIPPNVVLASSSMYLFN